MKYKKIIYVLVFWFAFYALIEIIMNFWFNENTPVWKTGLISLITALCTCYVLFKKNKNLTVRDLMTYQKKEIPIVKKMDDQFISRLSESLKDHKYVLMSNIAPNEIRFKNQSTFKSFGEIYRIIISEDRIIINSRPKLFTNFINEDAAVAEKIEGIENIINQNYLP
jgi:hypothetical protein